MTCVPRVISEAEELGRKVAVGQEHQHLMGVGFLFMISLSIAT